MSIIRKVRAVERLFGRLENEMHEFKGQFGLYCIQGCGKCCAKPDIEASPLEFLPWAFQLFLEHKALDMLEQQKTTTNTWCHLYTPLSLVDTNSGSCGDYHFRGLICRLFGFSANRDKYGKLRLITCKVIKESQVEAYNQTVLQINEGVYVPIFSDYYQTLFQIDHKLGHKLMPINKALKAALEEVLHYYAYRPFPKKYKRAS
ncbi:YkgJ family cysteine cluster protein [Aestuariivivens sp. NBU2969]|uniref:YkgJ family cysteine cluster protein n=1 Tax=Aestuariivivens sp. NBU2969 TaxID=2873267 RepID=UPI001CBF3A9B|nr:YkgJ family cysteine cluster protein [Aestuariivivens sp. NBU2969]